MNVTMQFRMCYGEEWFNEYTPFSLLFGEGDKDDIFNDATDETLEVFENLDFTFGKSYKITLSGNGEEFTEIYDAWWEFNDKSGNNYYDTLRNANLISLLVTENWDGVKRKDIYKFPLIKGTMYTIKIQEV